MAAVVVDTNVAVVATELAPQASPLCIVACVDAIVAVQSGELLIDETGLILGEYLDTLGFAGRPGVGRAFVKWVYDHQWDDSAVKRVPITRRNGDWRQFEEIPDEESLRQFDRDDQKFVAVAIASGENPEILNAVDEDWWDHRAALEACGVRIQLVCPDHFGES